MNSNVLAVAFVAIAAALPLSAATAQTAQPGVAADTAVSPEEPKKPTSRKEARERKANADARLCLEFPTNLMIHKCAEKYRLDKRET